MDSIETLMEQLNLLFSISEDFKRDLRPMLKELKYRNMKVLQPLKGKAKKAWQLLEGFIIFIKIDSKGKEIIMRIYVSGQILTDFPSFFLSQDCTVIIKAITPVKVLELKKKDFLKLDQYAETAKLVQRIMLQEQFMEATRSDLLMMPDLEKAREFAKHYPIDEVPNEIASEFLNMPISNYIEQKVAYQRRIAEITPAAPVKMYKNTTEMAYAIKFYIEEHFTTPDIGDTLKISKRFFTTRKTLTRVFKKVFGITVHKLITNLRMDLSQRLITIEGKSAREASYTAGYRDERNFNRNFKKHFGYGPGSRSIQG